MLEEKTEKAISENYGYAAARMNGITYNNLINGLKKANVVINRKMLAEIAVSDPKAFTEIAEIAKKA